MSEAAALIQGKIQVITQLPSIKVIKAHLVKALYNERASLDDIANIIRHDQSIASKVISVANSAFLGFAGKVNTLEKAILLLGFDLIKSIALAASLFNAFPTKYGSLKQLWVHSFIVATIASELARKNALHAKNLAFLSGLVHDIGRLVLLKIGEPVMAEEEGVALMESSEDTLFTLEKKLFGCNHAQAGVWFLENLNFPREVIQPVSYHHDVVGLPAGSEIAPLVFLAEGLAGQIVPAVFHDAEWGEKHQAVFAAMGFGDGDMDSIRKAFEKEDSTLGGFYEL